MAEPHRPTEYSRRPAAPRSRAYGGIDGFAVAALIFGLLGGCLLAVPFAIVALARLGARGGRGRLLAIGGLVASAVWAVLVAVAIAAGWLRGPIAGRPVAAPLPSSVHGNAIASNDLRVGDCVDGVHIGHIDTVTVLSCTAPHDAEVIGDPELPDAPWPGADVVAEQAHQVCRAELDDILRTSPRVAGYSLITLSPDSEIGWLQSRRIVCAVHDPAGGKLTGPLPR
ncbi:septum formation family protein [Nocardia arthritidis]|uniref:Uncharacterized protein n=1 Tax=Nocardia arthritidis TaxID=228602 RepID=A0A6G9YLD6_9NOCA|nr:septum formation family protein [Nocardia arthritidis]QIS13836.1 hypothetical protein F5544_29955 [Nocardia arthritidis]